MGTNAEVKQRRDYIVTHPQMSNLDLAAMFKVSIRMIRIDRNVLGIQPPNNKGRRKKDSESICWRCRKAANERLCSWVRNYVAPDGAVNTDGAILQCPEFDKELKR